MEETQTTTSGESTEVTSQETESTTTEPVVTSEETMVDDTTQDTSNDSTVTETEEAEPPKQTQDWEKNYKELQSEFTKKTQELSQLKKQQEQANAVVEQSGQIKQSVINQVAQQIALEELSAYRNAVFELDDVAQKKVNTLLNAYQQTNNRQYLDQAKEFYGSNFVGAIEAQKDTPSHSQIRMDNKLKFLGHIFDAASYLVDFYFPVKNYEEGINSN